MDPYQHWQTVILVARRSDYVKIETILALEVPFLIPTVANTLLQTSFT